MNGYAIALKSWFGFNGESGGIGWVADVDFFKF